ncbi:MAG: hydantoinase/oxoprolinase family protein [Alphaproteobacteria bacterium]|nr:hydantoinase/oxoprolinase family protein [Alphaproteobacteria bacterium]
MPDKSHLLGIDIGGTFTDFVLVDRTSGNVFLNKRLTTTDHPDVAVKDGIRTLLRDSNIQGANLEIVIHGTTLITNALIERKGARTALLATAGHKDVLKIGDEMRYDTYDLFLEKPDPLVPGPLRFDVPERLAADGRTIDELDEQALRQIAKGLTEAQVASVAVCFLHSFSNPTHERRARAILEEEIPDATISLSSEVAPEIREYQRMSTTTANAYVQPIAVRYLNRVKENLQVEGYGRPLFMMISSGGIVTHEAASRFPIRLVESGPAAGALASSTLGVQAECRDLISFDMGGTTAKACLIDGGSPTTSKQFEVARVKRFAKGSGLPLQVPVIEMIEIGAGGGSIARVDDLGLLKVGPESAGSVPGPACYGAGGEDPTVTDANLILGYLDAQSFLGGKMVLNEKAARDSIESLADSLGVDVVRAAQGILDVVNTNMTAAAKMHIAERGSDPRRYALMAFGGMGPMHAHAVARGLKLKMVICPASAGVLSAWGMLVAPPAFEFARSVLGPLDDESLAHLQAAYRDLEEDGARMLREAGVPANEIVFSHSVDMRYSAQIREITVPLPTGAEQQTAASVRKLFLQKYENLFEHVHEDVPIKLITCRLTATGKGRHLPNRARHETGLNAAKGHRSVYFETHGSFLDAAVYDRYRLGPGAAFEGPAIIEENESTVVVPPRATAEVDDSYNIVIRLDET